MVISLILLLFFSILELSLSNTEKIIFSFQMFRHGARAPFFGLENGKDKFNESWISEEELSNIGKRMLYLLGIKSRKRYIINNTNFLSDKYSPQEIYIKSTDSNRTIESIYSFLQGLYPSGFGPELPEKVRYLNNIKYPPNIKYHEEFDEQINKYNLNETGGALPYKMNIAPIHLIYKPDRDFELYDERYCPKRHEIVDKAQKSNRVINFINDIIDKTGNLFKDLEPSNNFSFLYDDYWNLYKYMDIFLCDDYDKRNFDYIKNIYGENIINILREYTKDYFDMDYFYVNFPESDKEVGLVSNSALMSYILNWMSNAKNKSEANINSYLKYVIYSAHDWSIAALDHLMRTLFNSTIEECSFGCSRIFELYKTNNEYYVRYLKGDDTIKLNLTYNEFVKKISENIWDWDKVNEYCGFEDKKREEKKTEENKKGKGIAYHMMIVLIIFDVILIIFLIAYCRQKRY